MASVLELIGKLGLNITAWNQGLDKADKEASKFGAKFVNKLGKNFGVAALIAGFIHFEKAVIETGKAIDELIDKLGLTAEEAQRMRLAEKLGGQTGRGVVPISEEDLESLRIADRLLIKLRETALAIGAKAFRFSPAPAILTAIAKGTGFVSAEPPKTQQEAIAREANQAIQERIVQLEKEAIILNSQATDARLTNEQKLAKALEERARLMELIKDKGVVFADEEAPFKVQKRIAELNLQIVKEQKAMEGGITRQSGGLPGVFVGAAANARGPQETNQILKSILTSLDRRGILVRGER